MWGQTYSALWKKAAEAEQKDLPQTAYDVLQQIVKKAEGEKAYGQLMKAELKAAQMQASIAPDSLAPQVKRLEARSQAQKDEMLKTVYQTVIYQICRRSASLEMTPEKPELTAALCEKLAQVKDDAFEPFVITGADSKVFGHDLLSIIGYTLNDYQPLHDYYARTGNRQAACLTALEALKQDNTDGQQAALQRLDSLIGVYGDMPEAGALAIERYQRMIGMGDYTTKDRIEYLRQALGKWPSWSQMNTLRNDEKALTAPQFSVGINSRIALPNREQKVLLSDLRNLKEMTMKVYKVKADGDLNLNPSSEEDYKKLKPLLTLMEQDTQKHQYTGKADYELFEDSMTLRALPVGVYMIEFKSDPTTDVVRRLYHVTDVYTMAEEQPDHRIRYVVVSATTGQPIPKAHLRIRRYISYSKYDTHHLVADSKGECYFTDPEGRRKEIFAYTDADKASPEMNLGSRYSYYEGRDLVEQTQLYTDRAIYRPGQTVHAAAIVYEVRNGHEYAATPNKQMTFTLRDANYKEVMRQKATTDKYGSASVDLTLPASGLTGNFTLVANGQTIRFRVEEYKRPTFEIEFDKMDEHYEAGDTVKAKATARSYAGVPVQGATVKYKVVRRQPLWWWGYNRYWDTGYIGHSSEDEEITSGETVTGDDGTFTVDMPMVMPESQYPLFYNFVVTADVTDISGETRTGQFSLPLGNRKTALSIDIEDKMLAESKPTATLHLRNAAGVDIDAKVTFRIDGGSWVSADTHQAITLPKLKSGRHTIEARYEDDIEQRDFMIFSLDDKRPADETDDWFWVSDSQFPNDGKPVTVQVGSSREDVHIVYSIFSGTHCIESGAVDKSNELINRKLTYKEAWGDGILLTFAWVKENVCYSHTAHIQRPLPDKHLKLAWKTFRDRLTPGQQEEWTLTVTGPDGKPADATLMSVLYDKSLDQLASNHWWFSPYLSLSLPHCDWAHAYRGMLSGSARKSWSSLSVSSFKFSRFDESVYPSTFRQVFVRGYGGKRHLARGAVESTAVLPQMAMAVNEAADMEDAVLEEKAVVMKAKETVTQSDADEGSEHAAQQEVQMRENLNETAFFYPQMTTDENGVIALKFTLPESLTTWRFMGLAHTQDMCYGDLTGEAVAKKDVMIQPNVPRFVREGDEATLSARIFNTGEKDVQGTAWLRLIDPETEKVVYETSEKFSVATGTTGSATFNFSISQSLNLSILICQVSAVGEGFSDGEQHYLPVLPSTERITVTLPFTQIEPGRKQIDLQALIPADGKNPKLTFEYTNNPAWLMIQALPTVGKPSDDNAISQAASFYANSIGRYILAQNPTAKKVFQLWQQERGNETSLMSSLEKNQELKDLVLNETPWVLDAERETEQKHRLADFFDENTMQQRLNGNIEKLKKLQQSSGAWSWWPGMPGSFYMTVAISEMLVRLNALVGTQGETTSMLNSAFKFMGREIVDDVREMKKAEKKGYKPSFPSFKALQWLYLSTLDGRELPSDVQEANAYLLNLMKKDIKRQTIYEKAMTAVILAESPLLKESDRTKAREYVQSLKEYTVYREEMGRYYDTPRAGYSWFDYKIPTQTMAIEALQRITPDDRQTIMEMQRWLLQSKRTQAWDTPINSVNAVYAFLKGSPLAMTAEQAAITLDGQPLETPKATAGIGYVKTVVPSDGKTIVIDKTSEGTSWGAVYAQFTQPTHNVTDSGSGLQVTREILAGGEVRVGDRVKIRITIQADRDYDFVQVIDRRAACLEPVKQLSGYYSGSYCTPRDNTTNYYFDLLSKGKHVIETEYYIDRPGSYETGTCTVSCAYAPEFRGTTKSQTINVK